MTRNIPAQRNSLSLVPRTRALFASCETDDPDQARGATGAEVKELEEMLQVKLPAAYLEFLSFAGAFEMDGPFVGSDCFLHHLPKLQVWFLEYMAETPVLHDYEGNWFAFFCHQGYDWAWFYLDGNQNPTIYTFDKTRHNTVQTLASLDDFFANEPIEETDE